MIGALWTLAGADASLVADALRRPCAASAPRSTVTRRTLIGLTIALLATGFGSATAAAADPVGSLDPGQSVHWDGPYTQSARVDAPELCGIEGPCWSYGIRVESGEARRLRVAIDWSERADVYRLELIDPSGRTVASQGSSGWNVELFAERPRPGLWTVRVIPSDVAKSSFDARARLDGPASPPATPVELLPNLQANPPWEPTLVGPVTSQRDEPAQVLGQTLWSCSPEEQALSGADSCLRFSVGPMNTGSGPYEARFDPGAAELTLPEHPAGEGVLSGPVRQRIYRSDGSHVDRDAGRFDFHAAHAHFHVQDVLSYSLHRVTDRETGRMVAIGTGRKASFCTYDLRLAEWQRFTSEPSLFPDKTVCVVPREPGTTELVMGITPGWSDVYTWGLADQYVDFAHSGDGDYVIQVEADPNDTIRESDDGDNRGYAYVRVGGEDVRLIERGTGSSPWDPDKVVLDPMP